MAVCPNCNKIVENLSVHHSRFHRERLVCQDITLLRDADGFFQCTLCPKKMQDGSGMQNHLRREHVRVTGKQSKPVRSAPYPASRAQQQSSTSLAGTSLRTHAPNPADSAEPLASRLHSAALEVSSIYAPIPLEVCYLKFHRQFNPPKPKLPPVEM